MSYPIALSYPIPFANYDNALYYNATDGYHGNEVWRLDSLALAFRVTNIAREGNNVRVTWTSVGGRTNILQAVTAGPGGYATNGFTDMGPMIAPTNTSIITTNYLDAGAISATTTSKYYRVRLVP